MKNEIWKDIYFIEKGIVYDYRGLYQVSNLGRVKSLQRQRVIGNNKYIQEEKILKQEKNKNGYIYVHLCKNNVCKGFRLHKIAIEVFIPDKSNFKSMPDEDRNKVNLDDLEINHIDENKQNNNISNLEWCTHKYNIYHGEHNNKIARSKYKRIKQYDLKGNYIKTWNSLIEASNKLNIIDTSICKCLKGKRNKAGGYIWRYADE